MLDGFVQDGEVNVDNIAFYKTKELATRMDAEIDFQRRGFYLGPQFETLDDNLQGQFMQFLLERVSIPTWHCSSLTTQSTRNRGSTVDG